MGAFPSCNVNLIHWQPLGEARMDGDGITPMSPHVGIAVDTTPSRPPRQRGCNPVIPFAGSRRSRARLGVPGGMAWRVVVEKNPSAGASATRGFLSSHVCERPPLSVSIPSGAANISR